jgi:hypothetical protein
MERKKEHEMSDTAEWCGGCGQCKQCREDAVEVCETPESVPSPTLLGATEALNTTLRQIEEELIRLNLGVSAFVPVAGVALLVFGKRDQAWRLLVKEGNACTPLASANRALRIEAVQQLPALLAKLFETFRAETVGVTAAARQAQDFLQHLRATRT